MGFEVGLRWGDIRGEALGVWGSGFGVESFAFSGEGVEFEVSEKSCDSEV